MRIIELKHYSRKNGRSKRNHYTKRAKRFLNVLTAVYIVSNILAWGLVLPYIYLNLTH